MADESPAGSGAPVQIVEVAPTTIASADSTTSGARMMMNHPWLAAAAVAVYATKVMWVKLREIGLAKRLKKQQAKQSKSLQDVDEDTESESDEEDDDDDVPQVAGAAEGPGNWLKMDSPRLSHRSIEVAPADC
ncbi:uncharacterized protein LOC6548042 [Drosophila erecta]|uniref:Uncharacterized protein n=1 Tax=Drosophila erecta TaxID=7220 RepID=B3NNS9_DROER|nr:uncharacterized protein LOC6548042 [Drosophila erecta]EDV55636.1 uncharacterized protein Dere_GG22205 [Drosophila erecta]